MLRRKRYFAAATLLLSVWFSPVAQGQQSDGYKRQVGNWFVEVSKDPFSAKKKTIAVTGGAEGFLALRCFPDEGLSALIMPQSNREYEKDALVNFKYRANEGEIVQDTASVFGPKAAILPNARQILQDAQQASKLYFRVETPDGTAADLQFQPSGAVRALAQIVADCPDEPKAPAGKEESPEGKH